jgi:S-adenosylmethionine synthetase
VLISTSLPGVGAASLHHRGAEFTGKVEIARRATIHLAIVGANWDTSRRIAGGPMADNGMRLALSALGQLPDEGPVEVVERKGLGHPDTICDGLAEAASLALSRAYRQRFGAIQHHNVDKVLLWGGSAEPAFGGGTVTRPIEVFLAGRATRAVKGAALPIEEIVEEACRAWLAANLHALDAERHVKIHALLRPSSADLVDLFARQQRLGRVLANDTSCGAGYAPLSALETAVLAIENRLNAPATKRAAPEIGEDVKVMAIRDGARTAVTLAAAMIGAHLRDADDYLAKRAGVAGIARGVLDEGGLEAADIVVNAADDPPKSLYLTVTGTSAEAGDDGEAGRGNRANGLIAPYRPMTMESLAGKNPVSHVGKIYNLAAGLIAQELVAGGDGIEAAQCVLASRIGEPVATPQIVDVRLRRAGGAAIDPLLPRVRAVVAAQLTALPALVEELLAGALGFDRWPLRGGAPPP